MCGFRAGRRYTMLCTTTAQRWSYCWLHMAQAQMIMWVKLSNPDSTPWALDWSRLLPRDQCERFSVQYWCSVNVVSCSLAEHIEAVVLAWLLLVCCMWRWLARSCMRLQKPCEKSFFVTFLWQSNVGFPWQIKGRKMGCCLYADGLSSDNCHQSWEPTHGQAALEI